jgi:hypothetical protein
MTTTKKNVSQNCRKDYASFAELKKHFNSVAYKDVKRVTFLLDKLLLKKHTYEQLLKKVCAVKSNDFKSVSRIKSHIAFRKNHNNFVYTEIENNNKVYVQLTDIN